MKKLPSPFVFISIFYAQEKWHELLPAINYSLFGTPALRDQLKEAHVFFSTHRGSSIRIALKYKDPDQKKNYKELVDPVFHFLEENPSAPSPVQFPITGFFTDFPVNEIKFNLYNERLIAPQGLSQIQAVLSQILLVFFEDHPVDDDALFTLMVFLHEAILDGLSDTKESKLALIIDLIEEIKNREKYARIDLFELQDPGDMNIPPIDSQPGMENLSIWFEYAVYLLNQKTGKPIETYFIILRIIQEHLMRIPDEIFLDSLQYVADALQPETVGRHLRELSDTHGSY